MNTWHLVRVVSLSYEKNEMRLLAYCCGAARKILHSYLVRIRKFKNEVTNTINRGKRRQTGAFFQTKKNLA